MHAYARLAQATLLQPTLGRAAGLSLIALLASLPPAHADDLESARQPREGVDPFGFDGEAADPFGSPATARAPRHGFGRSGRAATAEYARQQERQRLGEQVSRERYADSSSAASGPHRQKVIWADSHSGSSKKIRRVLDAPLTDSGLDFADTPLEEIVEFLRAEYGIEIQLDLAALDELAIGTDEQVSVNLRNIRLRDALRLMLKQIELTCLVTDGVLLVTTEEKSESRLVTAVYPVGDLANEYEEMTRLADVLVRTVAPETWRSGGGGQSEVVPLPPGLLVILQTQATHEEIQDVLSAIRTARAAGRD